MARSSVFVLAMVVVLAAVTTWAAPQAKTYQVTGPIVELTDTKIVVQKDDEKWELERDKDTKVTGDLKVGAKVTIQYRMYATTIASKDAPSNDATKEEAKPEAKSGAKKSK